MSENGLIGPNPCGTCGGEYGEHESWCRQGGTAAPADDVEDGRDALASRLIDAWVVDKGRKIPWAKAVQIVAIVTKQSDAERDRLLRMGDEDGSCEMCGRRDPETKSS
jgi:hypothetical protein